MFWFFCLFFSLVSIKSHTHTVIWDFDATLYKKTSGSYIDILLKNVIDREVNKYDIDKLEKINKFIEKERKTANTVDGARKYVSRFKKQFALNFIKEDFTKTLNTLNLEKTNNLDEIMNYINKKGHQMFIIGGSTFGCYFISEFVKNYNIKETQIYSGYFGNFSEKSIDGILKKNKGYSNCRHYNFIIPNSEKKSVLINFLKMRKIIKQNEKHKIIHIGDGENDLEVWNSGAVDYFIGFGENKISPNVKKNSPAFFETSSGMFEYLKLILKNKVKN